MLGLMPLYEGDGMCDDGVSYVLISPESPSPTLPIADSPYPLNPGPTYPAPCALDGE